MKAMKKLSTAIRFLKGCRNTHQAWADFYDEFPDEEDRVGSLVGSRTAQLKLVKKYDAVIALLQA
jgi:hypothetical protein